MTLYTYVVGRLSVSFDEQTLEWEARSPTLQGQIKKLNYSASCIFSNRGEEETTEYFPQLEEK